MTSNSSTHNTIFESLLGSLGGFLGLSWAGFGPLLSFLGSLLAHLGPLLAHLRGSLGQSWLSLGLSWALLGSSRASLWSFRASLGPSRASLEASRSLSWVIFKPPTVPIEPKIAHRCAQDSFDYSPLDSPLPLK